MPQLNFVNTFPNVMFHNTYDLSASGTIIKACLLTTAPTTASTVYADVSAHEMSNGNGYTTGGLTLANKALVSLGNGEYGLDCDNPSWTFTESKTFDSMALYLAHTISIYTYPLIGWLPLGSSTVIPSGQNWELLINANGLFTFKIS